MRQGQSLKTLFGEEHVAVLKKEGKKIKKERMKQPAEGDREDDAFDEHFKPQLFNQRVYTKEEIMADLYK